MALLNKKAPSASGQGFKIRIFELLGKSADGTRLHQLRAGTHDSGLRSHHIADGDLLERWTHGRLRSTRHRVRRGDTAQARQSIAFFSDTDDSVLIRTLPSCLPADGVSRYPAVTAGAHIAAKLAATY